MSRFNGEYMGKKFHRGRVMQLPGSVVIAPGSLSGVAAVPDFRAQSVTVTQGTPTQPALTINSASSAYTQDLIDINDAAGVRLGSVSNAGILTWTKHFVFVGIGTPAAAAAGQIRVYAGDSGAVKHLFFEDETGAVYDLGAAGPSFALSSQQWSVDGTNTPTVTGGYVTTRDGVLWDSKFNLSETQGFSGASAFLAQAKWGTD